MARKEKEYHFIYKTTNLLSGRFYIGMHSTDDLDDGYLGSGHRLKLAIKKYGKENFKREILEFVDNRKLLSEREEEIVNLDLLAREDCMNLKVGGKGGWPKSANEKFKWLLENDSEFRNKISRDSRESAIRLHKEGKLKSWSETYSGVGEKHTEETKIKISEAKKGTGNGDNNSQYGTCWVTKGSDNKKIKKEDLEVYIELGWIQGRVSNINGSSVKTSKLTEDDVINIKKMIIEGDLSLNKIGLLYSVSGETIGKIKRGQTWFHIKI